MEKHVKPVSGFLALLIAILSLAGAIFSATRIPFNQIWILLAIVLVVLSIFMFKGVMIINPNHSRVMVFFGKYVGTVKDNGLLWVNPFFSTFKISLRSQNLEGSPLKVNDKMGNPIEIAAVIVWQVQDTYRAAFEVADFQQYVKIQSEAAVRHLATSCPYDHLEAFGTCGYHN